MVGSMKGPPQEKLSGFYRPRGASALKGGYCHMLLLDQHQDWLSPICERRSPRRLSMADGWHTNRRTPPFTHIPVPYHVSCPLWIQPISRQNHTSSPVCT